MTGVQIAALAASASLGILYAIPSWAAPAAAAPSLTLTGTVIYQNGDPATDATVIYDRVDNLTHTVTTTIASTDQTGEYHLKIASAKPDTYVSILYAESPTGTGFLMHHSADAPQTIMLAPFTELHVHAVDRDGHPIPHLRICPAIFGAFNSITIWNRYIPTEWTQTTDAMGEAVIKNLPQGATIEFDSADDNYTPSKRLKWPNVSTTSINDDITVYFSPSATISGQVVYNSTHKSAAGIIVYMDANRTHIETLTDRKGRFTTTHLPEGTYSLRASVPSGDPDLWAACARTVTVQPGEKLTDTTLTLLRAGIVTGKVLNESGNKPISNALIVVSGPERSGLSGDCSTPVNPDGSYRVPVAPGTQSVSLWIKKNSQSQDLQGYPAQIVRVGQGEISTIDFKVSPPSPIIPLTVLVLDPGGNPVSGARVIAQDQFNRLTYGITDSSGQYAYPDSGGKVSFLARSNDLGTAAAILPADGKPVTLQLSSGVFSTFQGQVKDKNGAPISEAQVRLFRWSSDTAVQVDRVETDANGRYTFGPNFGNYKYDVSVSSTGSGPEYNEASSNIVNAARGQTVVFSDVILEKAESFVSGTVVNAHGKPIEDANVTIVNSSSPTDAATTDKHGRFTITGVTKGQTDISIDSPDGGHIQGTIPSDRRDNVIRLKYDKLVRGKTRNLVVDRVNQ